MTSQNNDSPEKIYPLTDADIKELIDYSEAEDAPACIRSICERIKKNSLAENTILLTFADKETADYVRLVCRRTSSDLQSYIIDNFEWDRDPVCIQNTAVKITAEMCEGCEEISHCPDAVKKPKKTRRRSP